MILFFLKLQALTAALLALSLLLFTNVHVVYSALLGAIVCIVPNFYYACKVFEQTGAQAAHAILQAIYTGEIKKLFLAAGLCFICFKWLAVAPLPFFVGWLVAQTTFIYFANKLHYTNCKK